MDPLVLAEHHTEGMLSSEESGVSAMMSGGQGNIPRLPSKAAPTFTCVCVCNEFFMCVAQNQDDEW